MAQAILTPLSGADSTLVTIAALDKGWVGGQHVRLRIVDRRFARLVGRSGVGWWGLEGHPFTIASAPIHARIVEGRDKAGSTGVGVQLVVKRTGSWTKALYDMAEQHGSATVMLEGPYGGPLNFLFASYHSVGVVVGGSGSRSSFAE